MRIVRLNGALGKLFGRVHRLDVRTPAEAIRALSANFPGFREHLIKSGERGVGYRCIVDRDEADLDRLGLPMSRVFSITPVVQGGGKILRIIAGVALAAVGAVTGQGWLVQIGLAVTLGGVAQLLAGTPKQNDAKQNQNAYFDGPVNTAAQGGCVPIGYGRAIVGSAVISAAVTVEQQYSTTGAIGGYWGGTAAA